ncbi:uncharacterized protein VTP21DRAFT_1361 [Calcarisporiella thermophila]|uniref:uncharacterized protein n=1 Tax=Calcarisporiella thermophila TaxID=911321 RepID=UPI00374224AF
MDEISQSKEEQHQQGVVNMRLHGTAFLDHFSSALSKTSSQPNSCSFSGTVTETSINDQQEVLDNQVAALSPPQPPDGGLQGWLVVLGSYLSLFATFGIVNAYGVFQDYYQSTMLSEYSNSVISLIGTTQLFLLYGLGLLVGQWFDIYGTRLLIPVGSFLTVFSLMMLSICQKNQIYQFFITQGILFGLGNALLFTPALAVIGQWFDKRRAYAIGIVASGSSLGGVVFPIMLHQLLSRVGFGWAVRIMAFFVLGCLSISILTVKSRLPSQCPKSLIQLIDFGGFRDVRYTLAVIGAFLIFYSVFIPYFYIQIFADFEGVSANYTASLLPVLNGLGILARVLPGFLADHYGCLNILVPTTFISASLIFVLWLPSRTAPAVIAFSALYGLFSGGFISLLPAYIAKISPIEKYGARLGMVYAFASIANLIGPPTAGTLIKSVDQTSFNHLIIFTGIVQLFGSVVWIIVRYKCSPRLLVLI